MSTELPWRDEGQEVEGAGIGTGFTRWSEPGQHLRGRVLRLWRSAAMKNPAATIELTETPTVPIVQTHGDEPGEPIQVAAGDRVNLNLTFDLQRKITRELEGHEIGVVFSHTQETRKGHMFIFRVVDFAQDELPF